MVKCISAKQFFIRCIVTIIIVLTTVASVVVLIDPYFHYHKPLPGLSYRMREERYTNPGIAKHFEYQTIITGTSMTRNFMPSKVNQVFDTTSVKLPIPGGKYGDVNELLCTAFDANPDIDHVIVTLDLDRIIKPYNEKNDETVPYYLYDDKLPNDVSYVLNKTVLVHDCFGNILNTLSNNEASTLDSYGSYEGETGKEAVLSQYKRSDVPEEMKQYSEEVKQMVSKNIAQNFISLICTYSDTEFTFIIPPYSIVYWDQVNRNGEMINQIQAQKQALDMLLSYENVSVYCFYDDTDMICDFNNYYDSIHFDAKISNYLIEQIGEQKHRITKDNLEDKIESELQFFMQYDYDALFQ